MNITRWLLLFCISVGLGAATSTLGQTNTTIELQKKLIQLKSNPNYLKDSDYLRTVNNLSFYYADEFPDSALLLLKDQAVLCRNAGYKIGEVTAHSNMGSAYQTKGDFEKALNYYDLAYQLALKYKYTIAVPGILVNMGLVYTNQGNYPLALSKYYEALNLAVAAKDKLLIGSILNNIAIVHFYQGKMHEADSAYHLTLNIALELNDTLRSIYAYNNIGEVKLEQNRSDSAFYYFSKAKVLALRINNTERLASLANNLGNTYLNRDSVDAALAQFEEALQLSIKNNYALYRCRALIGLAKGNAIKEKLVEAKNFGLQAMEEAKLMGQVQLLRDASEILADIYEKTGDGLNALKYYKTYRVYADSLNNLTSLRAAANENANFRIAQNKMEFEKKAVRQRWILFSVLAALITTTIIIWIINRNRKRLNQMNADLLQKNKLIEKQKQKVETTLAELKSTQAQLIQSEKMASLGELTAGIAHEIQNPLNFVNNFSEVSMELLDEMNEELDKGDLQEAKAIAVDVKQNLGKINHHGKRADAIVKGMLQHSRTSTGQREPTDINALCDEFLHLSYHGLRARDKSFNAKFETSFDESIGKINIVPQDIGRVILNLINNAFYACTERSRSSRTERSLSSAGSDIGSYEPTVVVSTKNLGNKVEVSVKDNGKGIPEKIKDKIFQPFFTTKPTGQGTGLGLSLSYDIVKAHDGEIKLVTKEGEGAEFIIQLPAA